MEVRKLRLYFSFSCHATLYLQIFKKEFFDSEVRTLDELLQVNLSKMDQIRKKKIFLSTRRQRR